MSDNRGCGDVIGKTLLAMIVLAIGVWQGFRETRRFFQREAVKVGAAEYHPTTGEWQWKKQPTTNIQAAPNQ